MYSSKSRMLVPLPCVSPALTVCGPDRPRLQPQPPPQRRELARLNTITIREKAMISSRPQSVQLPPIFGRGLCPHPPAQRMTSVECGSAVQRKAEQSEEEDSNHMPSELKNTGRCHDNVSLTPFKVIERAHQSFDRMQTNLAEKVTKHHIDRHVAKGRRYGSLEALRTDLRLRHQYEMAEMEKTLTLQRAKLEQEVQQARQKHAQFLEEKRRRIQEQEKVGRFSRQHISLATAVLGYNTSERGNQQ